MVVTSVLIYAGSYKGGFLFALVCSMQAQISKIENYHIS